MNNNEFGAKLAKETLTGDIAAFLIDRLRQFPKPYQQMSKKRTADALAGYVLPAVKPDADNLAKAALDACNGIIWRDDALICSLLVKKRYAAYPCLEIKVVPEETALFGR